MLLIKNYKKMKTYDRICYYQPSKLTMDYLKLTPSEQKSMSLLAFSTSLREISQPRPTRFKPKSKRQIMEEKKTIMEEKEQLRRKFGELKIPDYLHQFTDVDNLQIDIVDVTMDTFPWPDEIKAEPPIFKYDCDVYLSQVGKVDEWLKSLQRGRDEFKKQKELFEKTVINTWLISQVGKTSSQIVSEFYDRLRLEPVCGLSYPLLYDGCGSHMGCFTDSDFLWNLPTIYELYALIAQRRKFGIARRYVTWGN